ncbi:MAG: hypothetical protein IBX50_18065 [Marinospirillum sp.]|uniref:hypothetical protein n=1 Tax=Marinospirillum sp. TaxID=2183934 RepID=UPI001A0D91E9|nr:hypothetical protein [Marinospirillum sp.]MBE0508594.1 hypothetical protein [Marinospirillum sp.]
MPITLSEHAKKLLTGISTVGTAVQAQMRGTGTRVAICALTAFFLSAAASNIEIEGAAGQWRSQVFAHNAQISNIEATGIPLAASALQSDKPLEHLRFEWLGQLENRLSESGYSPDQPDANAVLAVALIRFSAQLHGQSKVGYRGYAAGEKMAEAVVRHNLNELAELAIDMQAAGQPSINPLLIQIIKESVSGSGKLLLDQTLPTADIKSAVVSLIQHAESRPETIERIRYHLEFPALDSDLTPFEAVEQWVGAGIPTEAVAKAAQMLAATIGSGRVVLNADREARLPLEFSH